MTKINDKDIKNAKLLIDSFLSDTDQLKIDTIEGIELTDSIGECKPLLDMVDSIIDKTNDNNLSASFPFERYRKFDPDIMDHDFRITVRFKDRKSAGKSIGKYSPLFELSSYFHTPHKLILSAIMNDVLEEGVLFDRAYRSIPPKISDVLQWVYTKAKEVIPALRVLHTEGIVNLIDSKTDNSSLYNLLERTKVSEGNSNSKIRVKVEYDTSKLFINPNVGTAAIRQNMIDELLKYLNPPVEYKLGQPPEGNPGKGIREGCDCSGLAYYLYSKFARIDIPRTAAGQYSKCVKIDKRQVLPGDIIFLDGSGRYNNNTIPEKLTVNHMGIAVTPGCTSFIHAAGYGIGHLKLDTDVSWWKGRIIGYGRFLNEDSPIPSSSLSEVEIAGVPESLDPSTIGSMKFSILADNSKDETLKQDITKLIGTLDTKLKQLSIDVYRRSLTKIYKSFVNDLAAKVEHISIDYTPGTSAYIPIAGEYAPIVQSTGGRIVQVSIRLKEVKIIDVARLSTMFRVSNNDSTIVSMLMTARSIYRSVQDSDKRIKYLMLYAEEKKMEDMLNELQGVQYAARFDEPVRIENNILNSLGLETFTPVSMELKTNENIAGAYNISLTFNYTNLGQRSVESLKKLKGGLSAPVLPIACRLGKSPIDINELGDSGADDTKFSFIKSVSMASINHGLSELLPLYVVTRINDMICNLNAIIKDKKERNEVLTIDTNDVEESLVMWSRKDKTRQWISDNDRIRRKEFNNTSSKNTHRGARITDTAYVGNSKWSEIGSKALLGAPSIGVALSIMKISKAVNTGTASFSKWSKMFYAFTQAGSIITSSILGSASNIGNPFATNGKDGTPRILFFNILAYLPYMITDLMREYAYAIAENKTDEFIPKIANDALDFFSKTKVVSEGGEDKPARMYKFPEEITIKDNDEKEYKLGGIVVSMYTSGMNEEIKSNATIPFTNRTLFLHKEGIGLDKISIDLSNRIKKMSSENINADGFANESDPIEYIVNNLMLQVVMCILNASKINETFGSRDGGLGNLEILCGSLLSSESAGKHAKQIVQSLFTSSFLDLLASTSLTNSNNNVITDIVNEQITKFKILSNSSETDPIILYLKQRIPVEISNIVGITDDMLPNNKINLKIYIGNATISINEIENKLQNIWNELADLGHVLTTPVDIVVVEMEEFKTAMDLQGRPLSGLTSSSSHIAIITGTLQLSSSSINIALTETITSHLETFKNDINKGREEVMAAAIPPEKLCGMFVDEVLTGNISKAYGQALLALLTPVEQLILSDTNSSSETSSGILDISESILKVISPVHAAGIFDFRNSGIVTAGQIARLIEPTTLTQISQMIESIVKYTHSVALDMSLIILSEIILAMLTQGFSVIRGIIRGAWIIYDLVSAAIAYMAGKGPEMILSHGSIFTLSHWLSGRIHDGMDSSTIIEMCYKTGIWLPSALRYSKDIIDNSQTSYLDYPIVNYISDEGTKPLPPDFYLYKIGFIDESYKEMRNLIDTVGGIAEEGFNNNESLDFEELTNTLRDRTDGVFDGMRTIAEEAIRGPLFPERVYQNSIMLTNKSKRLFKKGNLEEYDFAKYTTIANYIDDIYYEAVGKQEYSIVYMTVLNNLGKKYTSTNCNSKRTAMIVIDLVFSKIDEDTNIIDPIVKISNGDMFDVITKSSEYAGFTDGNFKSRINATFENAIKHKTTMSKPEIIKLRNIVSEIISAIFRFSTDTKQFDKGILQHVNETMPKTLGNLMMVKSLVGSNLKSIGRPGMNLFKKELNTITTRTLMKSSAFRSGYFYPTIKLYFIEEDSEAWYLFDDLYSYASVVSVIVHMDQDSPVQTAMIKVTNLYNHLNNMMADKVNMEMNFVNAPDENSGINALMLQVGCKIKIQAGNTPILTNNDTIFTGKITSIDFNQITSIEATSGGDVLTESVSKNSYETFGDTSKLTSGVINISKIASAIKQAAGAAANFNGNYIRPVTRIKDIASQVLLRITQVITTLADFTVNPALIKQPEQELQVSYNSYLDSLKGGVVKELTGGFLGVVGLTKEQVGYNYQLLENVNISGDRYWPILDKPSEGAWVSFDETAWDTLRELNLLLPNNILTVRPMDVRSTIVWGNYEGYYKFRNSVDMRSTVANQLIYKINPILSSNQPKSVAVFGIINKEIESSNEDTRTSGLSLAAMVAYYSQMIMLGLGFNIPDNERVLIGDDTAINRSIKWFSLDRSSRRNIEDIAILAVSAMSELSGEALDNIGDANAARLSQITMEDIKNLLRAIDSGITEISVAKALSTEFACEMVLKYCKEMACNCSTSHRKISDYHVKVSGRDIISNDLELLKPYNAVNLEFPKPSTEPDELLMEFKGMTTGDNIESTITPHLVHYKLKPWAWKIYQSYFKNINVFRHARSSSIAMVGASILTNLMEDTYGGSITILGDSSVRENDRILLWDETRDMYGVVGVKAHTFMFTPMEGCISVITPKMLVRNEFRMQNSIFDSLIHKAKLTISAILIGTAAWWLIRKGKSLHIATKLSLLRRQSSGLKLADKVLNTAGKRSSLRKFERIMPGFMKKFTGSKITMDELDTFIKEGPAIASEVTRLSIKARKSMEEIIISKANISEILSMLERTAKRTGTRGKYNTDSVEKLLQGVVNEITNSKQLRSLNKIDGETVETLFKSTLKSTLIAEIKGGIRGKSSKAVDDIFNSIGGDNIINSNMAFIMGRTNKTLLGQAKIPGGEFNKVFVKNINAINDIKQGTGREYKKIIDMVSGNIIGRKSSIIKHLKSIAGFATGYAVADWLTDTTRVFGEMMLIDQKTADNIVISPIFFRGEPLVAGLDGVEKIDGEHASNWDILTSRFGDTIDIMGYSVSDPISQQYFNAAVEFDRLTERSTGVDAGNYFKSRVK